MSVEQRIYAKRTGTKANNSSDSKIAVGDTVMICNEGAMKVLWRLVEVSKLILSKDS